MSEALRRWGRGAGLFVGPACWAVSTQAAYSVASQACSAQKAILTPVMLALIAVSLAAAAVSVFSARSTRGEWFDSRGGAAQRFLAAIGFGAGILFAVVMANQFAAMLVLGRCLR
jgi:hypothetical protein